MFGVKVILPCLKQLPLNSNLILELFSIPVLEKGLWFAVEGGLIFSIDNPLDSHFVIMFGRPEKVVTVL